MKRLSNFSGKSLSADTLALVVVLDSVTKEAITVTRGPAVF